MKMMMNLGEKTPKQDKERTKTNLKKKVFMITHRTIKSKVKPKNTSTAQSSIPLIIETSSSLQRKQPSSTLMVEQTRM